MDQQRGTAADEVDDDHQRLYKIRGGFSRSCQAVATKAKPAW